MKKLFSFVILLIWVCNLIGQTSIESDTLSHRLRKNAVYYEIGGIMIASLNYSRYISITEKDGVAISCGFCVTSLFGADYSLVPCEERYMVFVEANYLRGGPKHFLEVGYSYEFTEPMHQPRFGYRYQGNRGFIFRGALMFLTKSTKEFYYGETDRIFIMGLSFGYCF